MVSESTTGQWEKNVDVCVGITFHGSEMRKLRTAVQLS